ncbi:MAG: hypothetical protein NUW23_08260 [Firmicutes bacterium]|nr:hypothetical protein [Bacillota bacterium]
MEDLDRAIARLEDAIYKATVGRSAHPAFLEDLGMILGQFKAARDAIAKEAATP